MVIPTDPIGSIQRTPARIAAVAAEVLGGS
jgi:hypothetical protein